MDDNVLSDLLRQQGERVVVPHALEQAVLRHSKRRRVMAVVGSVAGAAVVVVGLAFAALPPQEQNVGPAAPGGPQSPPRPEEGVTAGTVDGVAWEIRSHGSCVKWTVGKGSGSACFVLGSDVPLASGRGGFRQLDQSLIYGAVTAAVDAVTFETDDGTERAVGLSEGEDVRHFGFWIPQGSEGVLIATDETGKVIARQRVR